MNKRSRLILVSMLVWACMVGATARAQDAGSVRDNAATYLKSGDDSDSSDGENSGLGPVVSPQAATQASTQPSTQPRPRSLLQPRVDEMLTTAIYGRWLSDVGVGEIYANFDPDGKFRMAHTTGDFRVHADSLLLMTKGGCATYKFRFEGKILVLSGGDLRQEVRFSRQSNVNDALTGIFEFSANGIQRRFARILLALAIMVTARLVISLLRGLSYLIVSSDWGILAYFYRTNKSRARTVHSLVLNAAKYIVYFTAIGFILGELGVDYTAYLASLSVIGLAIAFGSQGLVQDTVTGFFIILESQFDVGDMVEVSGQTGVVIEFGLRTTTIRNYLGQVIVIPNRAITQVSRYKLNSQLAIVDIRLTGPDAIEPAKQVLHKIGHELNTQFAGVLKDNPDEPRPVTLETGELFLRVGVLFWPGQQWVVEAHFVPRIKEAFKANKIEIPGDQVILFYHAHNEEHAIDWREYLHLRKTRVDDSTPA